MKLKWILVIFKNVYIRIDIIYVSKIPENPYREILETKSHDLLFAEKTVRFE